MTLKLKNIYCYGDNKSMVFISIEAHYGWQGKMYGDILKINYNGQKRQAFLTVMIKNSGVGAVIEKIIELLTNINISSGSINNPPLVIVERMSEVLKMEYDPKIVNEALNLF